MVSIQLYSGGLFLTSKSGIHSQYSATSEYSFELSATPLLKNEMEVVAQCKPDCGTSISHESKTWFQFNYILQTSKSGIHSHYIASSEYSFKLSATVINSFLKLSQIWPSNHYCSH